jgi:aminopeptidase N
VKAPCGVSIIVPAPVTALSNMPASGVRHVAGGKKKFVFADSPK